MSERRGCVTKRLRFRFALVPLLEILPDRLGVEVDPVAVIESAEALAEFAGREGVTITDLGVDARPTQCTVFSVDAYLQGNEVIFSRTGCDAIEQVAEAGAFVSDAYFQWRGQYPALVADRGVPVGEVGETDVGSGVVRKIQWIGKHFPPVDQPPRRIIAQPIVASRKAVALFAKGYSRIHPKHIDMLVLDKRTPRIKIKEELDLVLCWR